MKINDGSKDAESTLEQIALRLTQKYDATGSRSTYLVKIYDHDLMKVVRDLENAEHLDLDDHERGLIDHALRTHNNLMFLTVLDSTGALHYGGPFLFICSIAWAKESNDVPLMKLV